MNMKGKNSVANPDDFEPDSDQTFEKKPEPDTTPEKMRIRILLYVKFLYQLFLTRSFC
jgi:hypothetical protein